MVFLREILFTFNAPYIGSVDHKDRGVILRSRLRACGYST